MDEYFAAIPVSNATCLCVGGITHAEAETAQSDGVHIDGSGYYLFLAKQNEPKSPIKLLARFFSPAEAESFARMVAVA